MKTLISARRLIQGAALLTGAAGLVGLPGMVHAQVVNTTDTFNPGNLVLSRSVYLGVPGTVTVGQTLPGGGNAVADGTYPNVFSNEGPDASFGVTAPIYLDQLTTSGAYVNTIDVSSTTSSQIVTSFSSKSELGLNLSTDGKSLTFMGYGSPINALDVSNSNTPGITEPGNPVTTTPTYREVYQLNADGTSSVTTSNAYDGNNGRNAILDSADHQYFTVGNAGNGNGSPQTTAATGVQIVIPGQNATANTPGTIKVGGYNITENGYKADKTVKDDNYRGETIFNNTLYVTKGSGSNGIDTVYQVGTAGTLPTSANAANAPITILPGFDTTLAKTNANSPATNFHPFGLFFANASTLYVADEGDGVAADVGAKDPHAGLDKYSFVNGNWQLDYTLQTGLNLGTQYTVSDPNSSATYPTATDGLRNITGSVSNGIVTIYGVTSTVSAATDQGADPNKLVAINDVLADTTSIAPPTDQFTTLDSANYGEVLRGVADAPTISPAPEPSQMAAMGLTLAGLLGLIARKRKSANSQA